MPLCGFNEKMLKGLAEFNEGLVEYGLQHRSELNGETIDQAIKREISDMTRLFLEINRIDDSSKRVLTEGIAKYAMGFYLIMRKKNIDNYKEVIEKIGQYFNPRRVTTSRGHVRVCSARAPHYNTCTTHRYQPAPTEEQLGLGVRGSRRRSVLPNVR